MPDNELWELYDNLVAELSALKARGGWLESVRYGRGLVEVKWYLEQCYLTAGSLHNPYRHLAASYDEIMYSYQEANSGFLVRKYYWQSGLTAEQLELYQTLRGDGTPIEQARKIAKALTST